MVIFHSKLLVHQRVEAARGSTVQDHHVLSRAEGMAHKGEEAIQHFWRLDLLFPDRSR